MRGTVLTLLCAIYFAQGRDILNKNGNLVCTCDPSEAANICAAWGSEGTFIAHEKCNKYYKCAFGKPVPFCCSTGTVYNPNTERCDWPRNVDCGDREIALELCVSGGNEGGGDEGNDDGPAGNETCNCNPAEAPAICAAAGSEGTMIAHEYCNYFYQCSSGRPVARRCGHGTLYNPYTERCDWPHNVDCGDRVIQEDNNDNGGGNPGGAGNGTCNCNPEEAPSICAADGSDSILVAHEDCNRYYICNHGRPVTVTCQPGLLFNPYTNQCDWPRNVDCGDRNIPQCENGDNGDGGHCICVEEDEEQDNISNESNEDDGPIDGGSEEEGGDNGGGGGDVGDGGDGGAGGGAGGGGGGTCNCNPGEAPGICAQHGSDGVLIAHENCNQFYKCANGDPVAMNCYGNLLYNPYTEQCDWPENVDCGDRVIPDCDDSGNGDSGAGGGGGDGGEGGDGGAGGGGGGGGGGTCNCNPGEAPGICAQDGSDGILIAHENCNQFYKCANGDPVAMNCYGNLLYNPYTEQCDWPENVDCGDRVIPDCDDSGNGDSGAGGGGGDGGEGGDGGAGGGGGGGGGGTCNCNPGEAPGICAQDGSDGVLIAHENCNQFYKCANGVPVAMNCYGNLLYNPYTERCDWPKNVDCGDRVIPDGGDGDSDDNGGGSGGGDGGDGGDDGAGGGGGGGGGGACNCNPGEAPGICAQEGSDGVLIAHENCNQFYKCFNGHPVALKCYGNLLYNPYTEQCDWPENVDCGDRIIPDGGDGDNDDNGGGGGGGDGGDGGDGGTGGGGGGDNGGTCNCNPSEAPDICAQNGSDGVLIAHENCNQFYKCANGDPVAMNCYGNLLYNPYTQQCDWPENVDCGDRVIPDCDDSGNGDSGAGGGGGDGGEGGDGGAGGGGGGGGGGTCNCNPGEAPGICAQDGSDGVLIAHENCNQFYKCANGVPVAMNCYGNLLYNPYTERCDWPKNVDCGDRVIPDGGDGDSDDNGGGSGGGDGGDGGDDGAGGGGGGGGGGACNCNPGEAPGICAQEGSDGVLIAHENCNQFYKCFNGHPVALKCYGNLLYNPYTEQCDWPENVDCGDRIIPDGGDGDNDDNGGGGGGGDGGDGGDGGTGGGGGGDNGGTCNCNPSEAPDICAQNGSDGVLIAHENCNQFYKCANGDPVAMNCYGNLLYNPYTQQCDWPENVDCGDRVIPDCDDSGNGDSGAGGGGGDGGEGGDGGAGGGGGGGGGGTCNCNPGEAPGICAQDGSDGVLIAHENCNQFYKCANGVPVAMNCYGNLLYNPYTQQCDWPENVDCGDRVIPDCDDSGNGDSGAGGGGGDGGEGGDGGAGGGGGGGGGGTCNCNPGEAPGICAQDGSDGVLIAHENCNQFYKCANGVPVAMNCYGNLLYNPYTQQCDWPENVDCGDRVIPDCDDSGNGDSGAGGGGGDGSDGGDGGAGGGGGGDNGGTCNCNPSEAPDICAQNGSDGVLIAHENCNQFYKCANGVPVAMNCYGNLLYNPYNQQCDWPENVDCGDRVIPDCDDSGNGDSGAGGGGGDGGDGGDGGAGGGGGGDNGGTCNCNPSEAPDICAQNGSDGVLIAHENCNQFYKCANGVPVAMNCYGNLLYNPYTQQCDWPENVDCGDRVIPDCDDSGNGDSGAGGGGGDGGEGGDGGAGGGGGGGGGGTCNCNPGEAPGICAQDGSDGVLIAHENCNQFYKCSNGLPVALTCNGNLLYNPYTEQCDWPENVDCGNRLVPHVDEDNDQDDSNSNIGGDNISGEQGDGGVDHDLGNEDSGNTCNCNPNEAATICAGNDSEGVHIAHENCNQFYQCAHGRPVAHTCSDDLLYNPYSKTCDWPNNVECVDRVIPECDGNSQDNGNNEDNNDNNNGNESSTCNCDPAEAPAICASLGSAGVLIAHEHCNRFYQCVHGIPVTQTCYPGLLYNPYKEQCDWPDNVKCGDRVISVDDENVPGGNGQGGDNNNNANDNNGGNDDPSQAPTICGSPDSNGVLVAHEKCNKFYMCSGGIPIVMKCPSNLLFNPTINDCDWPNSVKCDNRIIPDSENDDDDCHCNPKVSPAFCSAENSNGLLIAHENCNQYYVCVNGQTVEYTCSHNRLYNADQGLCDFPAVVDCDIRLVSVSYMASLNKHSAARKGIKV